MKSIYLCTLFALGLPIMGHSQIINFDSLNGYSAGLENRLVNTRDRLLSVVTFSEQTQFDLSYRYVDREVDPVTERIRRDMDGSGIRLAVSFPFGNWSLGLDVDYDRVTTDYLELNSPAPIPTNGTIKTRGLQVAANLAGHAGDFRYTLGFGWGRADHDGTRRSDIGLSGADYDSKEYFAIARLEYVYAMREKLDMVPFVGISTMSVSADGFQESGTAADRRIVSDFKTRETMATLGLRLDGSWGSAKPSLAIAWIKPISNKDFELGINAINGAPLGVGIVEPPYSSLFHVGVSMPVDLGSDWTLTPAIRYQTGGDESLWNLKLSLSYRF